PMNYLTTDLIEALAKKQDIEEVFRRHLETAINQLLKHELTAFLNYEPYAREGFHSGNSRNGFYDRTFKTEYGELQLAIPRDRNGECQQDSLAPYQRSNDTLEQFVIHLYEKGITTDEIADLMERMYGHHYSRQTVSNFTQLVAEDVQAFHERKLEKRYVHLSGCHAYSHSSSDGRKGSRLYCHRHYRRRNERSFRLHHCTNRIYACMERNDSTSTSERIGTSPSVHFRWFTWHDGRHSPCLSKSQASSVLCSCCSQHCQ